MIKKVLCAAVVAMTFTLVQAGSLAVHGVHAAVRDGSCSVTKFGPGRHVSARADQFRCGGQRAEALDYGFHRSPGRPTPISPALRGAVVGYRLSGVEPDGDPLYEVLLKTTLSPSHGVPRTHLIVDSYMENFQPDTTPILPDLLHPTKTAQNLGGFLEGKALLTDDAGTILYRGIFTAEAFLDNTNHAVIRLGGTHAAAGAGATIKGAFTLHKDASLNGRLTGNLALPAAARSQLLQHQGATMRPVKQILSGVVVKPHPMVGKSTSGAPSTPLPTGYSQVPRSNSQPSSRPISPVTIIAGFGAALSFILAGLLWWWQRRQPTPVQGAEPGVDKPA